MPMLLSPLTFCFYFSITETQSLTTLITAILQRMGDDIEPDNLPQIMVHIYSKTY